MTATSEDPSLPVQSPQKLLHCVRAEMVALAGLEQRRVYVEQDAFVGRALRQIWS